MSDTRLRDSLTQRGFEFVKKYHNAQDEKITYEKIVEVLSAHDCTTK